MPLGGRAQVVYRVEPDPNKPGLGILRRGFEAPIGRPVSQIPAHEFITNVLYFAMTFWGADTTTWELTPELDPSYDTANPPHPPSRCWLCSRYLPEAVQVTVVLEPDRGKRTSTGLSVALSDSFPASETGTLFVDNTRGFYNVPRSADSAQSFLRDPRHYLKIDNEWIYYEHVASPTAFTIPQTGRGLQGRDIRGTVAAPHVVGAEVYRGHPYVFTVAIPAFKHWQR
jgi:hypothetical protein